MTLTDCYVALLAACVAGLMLFATDIQPGKMLGMFAGPQLTVEVPTIHADPKPYRRKP